MARTKLTKPAAYTPVGVRENYDDNIDATNDAIDELYSVIAAQSATNASTTVTNRFVSCQYLTSGAKTITLPAVASTTLRRVTISKDVANGTVTVAPASGEKLNSVVNGTITFTAQYTVATFWVQGDSWYEDLSGRWAGVVDDTDIEIRPSSTSNHINLYTDVSDGTGAVNIYDTGTHAADEIPVLSLRANQLQLGLGTSYVWAKMQGASDGLFEPWSGGTIAGFRAKTGFDLDLRAESGKTINLQTGTYVAELTADSSSRLVSTSGFAGSGAGLTGIVDGALSANVPLLNLANAFTAAQTATVLTGVGQSGIGTLGTPLRDLSAFTGSDKDFGAAATKWIAQKISPSTGTLTSLAFRIKRTGTLTVATSTITAYLYADNASPTGGTLRATSTSIPFSALGTSYATFFFGGFSYGVASGTDYWVVLKASAVATAGTIEFDAGADAGGTSYKISDGSTWSAGGDFKLYLLGYPTGGIGLSGVSTSNDGVRGASTVGYGVSGTSTRSSGVYGTGPTAGVFGTSNDGIGGYFTSATSYGVWGVSSSGYAVRGSSTTGSGVYGFSTGASGYAVLATSTVGVGLLVQQSGASGTKECAIITRPNTSNGTGTMLLVNNAGSAVAGHLIQAQTGGVDKFSVGVEGNIITSGSIAATGNITSNSNTLCAWRGASSAEPSTTLVDGQLYFDTDNNTLYIYYSSAWHACYTAV